MNFGALTWYDSFIKKLKKAMNYITQVIDTYVCVYIVARMLFPTGHIVNRRT